MSGVRKKLKAKNDKSSGQWAVGSRQQKTRIKAKDLTACSGPLAVGINKWKVERKKIKN